MPYFIKMSTLLMLLNQGHRLRIRRKQSFTGW